MRASGALDPYVKDFPPGMQDSLYGRSMCLKGQLGPICLFPEYFSSQQIKCIHDLGNKNLTKIQLLNRIIYNLYNHLFRSKLFFT